MLGELENAISSSADSGNPSDFPLWEREAFRERPPSLAGAEPRTSQWARCFNGTVPDPNAKWYGTHVTLIYGKGNDPLPEGESVEITVVGRYRSADICGLLVSIPGYSTFKHITLTTRNDATPGQSNTVIEKLFAGSPDYNDLGREIDGVEWVVPYKLQGWYGNYYN